MIKHYVNLDVSKREPRRVIPISLGDNAVHKIIFTLSNGSEIIELPAYCNASVCVRNGVNNGYGEVDTATVDDNTVIYEPSITSTYKKGNVACDLIIADRNNRKLYAPVFYLYIDEDFSKNIEKELNEALENHEAWAIITQTANNADIAETSAQNAQTHAENAEAWAVGEKNGIALTNGDQYENNAKYYAEQAKAELENCVKKVNRKNAVYCTDENGDDTSIFLSAIYNQSVEKSSATNILYGTGAYGQPNLYAVDNFDTQPPSFGNVVIRDRNNDIMVPLEPGSYYAATSRQYVTTQTNALSTRINSLSTQISENTALIEKLKKYHATVEFFTKEEGGWSSVMSVPDNVLPYAEIMSVGGRSFLNRDGTDFDNAIVTRFESKAKDGTLIDVFEVPEAILSYGSSGGRYGLGYNVNTNCGNKTNYRCTFDFSKRRFYVGCKEIVLDGVINKFTTFSSTANNRARFLFYEYYHKTIGVQFTHYSFKDSVYADTADEVGYYNKNENFWIRFGSSSEINTLEKANKYLQEQYDMGTPVKFLVHSPSSLSSFVTVNIPSNIEYNNIIKVVPGGTIKAVNELNVPVWYEVEYEKEIWDEVTEEVT